MCVELQSHSLSSKRVVPLRRPAPTQNRASSSPFSPSGVGFPRQKAPPGPRAGRSSSLHDRCPDLWRGNSLFAGTTLPAEQEAEGGRRSGAALHYFPLRLQMAASFPTFRSVS